MAGVSAAGSARSTSSHGVPRDVPGALGATQTQPQEQRGFQVHVFGRIESGQLTNVDEVSCAYEFVVGADWQSLGGEETSETQAARNQVVNEDSPSVTWNFPIEASFQTTNAAGWPRVALCLRDGNRNIIGYAAARVPTQPGQVVRYCKLFTPLTSTILGDAIASLTSEPAEFYDAKFSTVCPGRESVRVVSAGVVKLVFMVRVQGHTALGYS
ncbi:B9 domain-containing protein 1 [Hondaea fermentalgiana]|uniref:B9 domain-containing protein 1 n=1 Tax=Hondaea fermentalgiana TaxID=2315210 RepID=A0A2R5GR25_9STRA|nr:B9 domain-containing protein 1 [Hondaea fermentalgiana]|eukprot:GBG31073.1 B9 domain-containing protein 1 [Hondaea fermentalgiana]